MADKLQEKFESWYKEFTDKNVDEPTPHQAFAGGFTASAVSMRDRAIVAIRAAFEVGGEDVLNNAINAVGSLPDIPE